jgi:hypothetical protein
MFYRKQRDLMKKILTLSILLVALLGCSFTDAATGFLSIDDAAADADALAMQAAAQIFIEGLFGSNPNWEAVVCAGQQASLASTFSAMANLRDLPDLKFNLSELSYTVRNADSDSGEVLVSGVVMWSFSGVADVMDFTGENAFPPLPMQKGADSVWRVCPSTP